MRHRLVQVLLLLLAAAGLAGLVRRRTVARDTRPVAWPSRSARSLRLAYLGGRISGTYATHRVHRAFVAAGRRRQLDLTYQLRTAEEIAETLGDMKGAMMKLGQLLGYLGEGLPEPFRVALARLQQDAPPMAPELAAAVVEQELGLTPDRLFARWDPLPVAAASIGQVHRAITREGLAVAVKVQYPGVDEAIRADLDNVRVLFGAMRTLFPALETGPMAAELRTRVAEELDYGNEAANQRLFARYYRGHPFIHVPAVVDRYCTRRVLTTELAEGVRFDELEQWSQPERDLAAEAIYRFVFRSLYRLRAFNGDPHPGNYLFQPGGRVTFLDFGLIKRFDEQEISGFSDMVRTLVLQPDAAAFRQVAERVRLLLPGAPVDDEEIAAYFRQIYDFVVKDEIRTIPPLYATHVARGLFEPGGPNSDVMRVVNVPPPFVIVQRINLGLYAILARLGATANWRCIAEELWPFTDASPSTALGREEAAWLAAEAGAGG